LYIRIYISPLFVYLIILQNLNLLKGQDTVVNTLPWTLARIGYHKDVQEKLAAEMHSIFNGDINRPVSFDDLRKMDYTEMVIKETLRLHTTVPLILRELENEFQLGGVSSLKF